MFPRDVMVNTAVTIVPRVNGIALLGTNEQDNEICQYAFELVSRKLPWPEKHLRAALKEQMELVLKKMRAAGLVRQ